MDAAWLNDRSPPVGSSLLEQGAVERVQIRSQILELTGGVELGINEPVDLYAPVVVGVCPHILRPGFDKRVGVPLVAGELVVNEIGAGHICQ